MPHNKRQSMPKNWPMTRKGNVYFVNSSHAQNEGMPLLVALRDVLKIVQTAKEVRMMTLAKEVLVNQKVRQEVKFPVQVFDVLSLPKVKKNYRLEVVGKRLKFVEVDDKAASRNVAKIIGKVLVAKDVVQMNLEDGTNLISKEKFSVGDTAVISLKDNKLEKVIPLKEGAKVLVVGGKHSGKHGKVAKINMIDNKKEYLIKFEEGEAILPVKTLLAID
jgi:small subunit ribosomal protein S4e